MPQTHSTPPTALSAVELAELADNIRAWGLQLGFQQVGITDIALDEDEAHLLEWLARGRHGEMGYMQRHGTRRSRPGDLLPGTARVISVRMDYWPPESQAAETVLDDPVMAYLSRYALGRDYHKVLRKRLQQLAGRIESVAGPHIHRVFTDSAPVLEKALARNAGLGWIGKHTNLINDRAGSWFFLGELYTSLPLPPDTPGEDHCGTCRSCIDACPTAAIVAPYQLDARLCISYLTIELRGAIPEPLRPLIGNRIYGCDDCQLVCPWNRFARPTREADFAVRHGLDATALVELFGWSNADFEQRLQGNPVYRIGHACWLRNIAVALGNAPTTPEVVAALEARRDDPSELVREHVAWALARHAAV